jgi:hypothetical protein
MPDNQLSARIGLDTTDFKTSIATLNREMRVVESGFRASAASLGDWAASTDGLEMRLKALNKEIDLQQGKVGALQGEYDRVSKEQGETSKAAQELQIRLNRETETLGKMQSELGSTQGKLDGMGKESSEAAKKVDDLDKSEKEAKKSTANLGDALKVLGNAAKVGASAVAGVAAAAAGVAAGVTKLVTKSADAAGELVDLSLKTGISVERLQELRYAGEQVGTDLDTMTSSLAKMTRSMSDVGSSKAITDAFTTLGVNARDANGELRNSETVFGELIDALGKVDNETERDALAMEIFGRSVMELNPLIKTGSDELAALSKEAHQMGAVMDEDAVMGLEGFGDQLASLKTGLQGTLGTLASAVLPAFSGLAGGAQLYLGKFAEIVQGADSDLGEMADGIGKMLGEVISKIASKGPEILQAGLGIIQGLGDSIITALPKLLPTVIKMITALVQFIGQAVPQFMNAAVKIIGMLASNILKLLPMLLEVAVQIILTLALGIAEALPGLVSAVIEIIPSVLLTLIKALPTLIPAAVGIILALIDGLVTALPELIKMAPEILVTLNMALMDALPMIGEAAVDIVLALVDGVIGALPEIGEAAIEIIVALTTGIWALMYRLLTVGYDIVTGIWEGIAEKKDWLVDQIFGFFGGVIDAIKKLLGISSPSKVFAGIGSNMALGLGSGFADQFKGVQREINRAVSGLEPSASLAVTGSYPGQGVMLPGKTVQVTVNATIANGIDMHLLARRVVEEIGRRY